MANRSTPGIKPRRKADGSTVYDVDIKLTGGRRLKKTFASEREAKRFIENERADDRRGVSIDTRQAGTVDELAERYLAWDPSKASNSVARDRSILYTHILPVIGGKKVDAVTWADIQALVNRWTADGCAKSSIVRQYATLRAMFKFAVFDSRCVFSPCHDIRLPTAQPRKATILNEEQLDCLLDHLGTEYGLVVCVAIVGPRWAEIAGLRVKHFDALGHSLEIDGQRTRDHGNRGAMVDSDETKTSRRKERDATTVAIPVWLSELLSAHMAARGLTVHDRDAYLFTAPDGGGLHYNNFRTRVWLPATKAADLDGLRFHDLRHAAATYLTTNGIDVKTMAERLGITEKVALKVYAQRTDDSDRAAADSIPAPAMGKPWGKSSRIGGDR